MHRIHWDLNRHLFSVVLRGRVLCHAPYAELRGATFRVQRAARLKLNFARCGTAHAYVSGELAALAGRPPRELLGWRRVRYNPHRAGCFHLDDGTPVTQAAVVRFYGGYCWVLPEVAA